MTDTVTRLPKRVKDIAGMRFERLVAIEFSYTKRGVGAIWKCVCDCGKTAFVGSSNLTKGNTNSCGCLKRDATLKAHTTHGMSNTPEFLAWVNMWRRTTDPRDKNYCLYKDRAPPESWRSFDAFFAELGRKPSNKHSLDRINNELPYGPGNCRWATQQDQVNNTSANVVLTHNGVSQTVAQWADCIGIKRSTIYSRIRRGASVEVALGMGNSK